MIAFSQHFPIIAYFFAGLTMMSALARIALAYGLFADDGEEDEG
jgi:hypothetical protein